MGKNGPKMAKNKDYLKVDFHLQKKKMFYLLNKNPSKIMKNAFYFILKAQARSQDI